jgi:hypothetical protein
MMQRYQGLSGDSGVESYDCGADWITVRFTRGGTYLYDRHKPGPIHVQRMKDLAPSGDGLGTYINQYVRGNCVRLDE